MRAAIAVGGGGTCCKRSPLNERPLGECAKRGDARAPSAAAVGDKTADTRMSRHDC